jgi:predicted RNA-binding Zn-ribbon protein involved in translation (DUF1610 family)
MNRLTARDMNSIRCRECDQRDLGYCSQCREKQVSFELTCTCGHKQEVDQITDKMVCPQCSEKYIRQRCYKRSQIIWSK